MSQNRSHAVMAQRAEPHDSLDFFPTPPWAVRAFLEHAIIGHGFRRDQLAEMDCWEPACGEGHMARPLAEYFRAVHASDVHPYGFGAVDDFLMPTKRRADWIITNPPFRLTLDFAERAIDRARVGVAMLVRSTWAEGGERYARLFKPRSPWAVAQHCERVPMVKGRYDPKASSATGYAWFVWRVDGRRISLPTEFRWIPPCRKQFERAQDATSNSNPERNTDHG